MRRLYSTFARGGPGAGLLLMRLVAGIAAIADGVAHLQSGLAAEILVIHVLAMAAGILLLAGLWTPISASVVAVFAIWVAVMETVYWRAGILLAAIGAALALLGPGIWSIDARLFGWKRIDLRDREP